MPATIGVGESESYLRADPELYGTPPEVHTPEKRRLFKRFTPVVIAPDAETLEYRHTRLSTLGMSSLIDAEVVAARLDVADNCYTELFGEDRALWEKFLPTSVALSHYRYDSIPQKVIDALETAVGLGCFEEIVIWTPEGNDVNGRLARRREVVDERLNEIARDWSNRFSRSARRVSDLLDDLWPRQSFTGRTSIATRRGSDWFDDPMAIGRVTDSNGVERLFPIIRWGESLWSLDQIKAYVAKVDRQERNALLTLGLTTLVGKARS
jgi:hypothetical protein